MLTDFKKRQLFLDSANDGGFPHSCTAWIFVGINSGVFGSV